MSGIIQDLKFALSSYFRTPGFFIVAVLTLALGIGATTTIFSVVDSVVLRPLPYQNSEELMVVGTTRENRPGIRSSSPMRFFWWRDNSTVFSSMFATRVTDVVLTGYGPAQRVRGAGISADYFDTMGVEPAQGRRFSPDEDSPESPPVVVITHDLWQRVFAGKDDVIGRTMTMNQNDFTVIGVMAESFHPPAAVSHDLVDLWFPLAHGEEDLNSHIHFLRIAGRLRPDADEHAAREEISRINAAFNEQYPQQAGRGADVVPMRESVVGPVGKNLFMLLGSVSLLLLIACTNVASLLLTRANGRQQELALRTALGARRIRILRQLLTESIVLAAAGGLAGVMLADLGVKAFRRFCPIDIPRLDEVRVDMRVLFVAMAVALATGVIFGLLPAWRMVRHDSNTVMRSGARNLTSDRGRNRLQHLLVVGETSLALVLLLGAGLLINSFVRLQSVDPGFDPNGMVVMEVNLGGGNGYDVEPRQRAFFNGLMERLESIPGIDSVAGIHTLALREDSTGTFFLLEGQNFNPQDADQRIVYHEITPGYFKTLGIPLLQGRDFDARDQADSERVLLVNQSFVDQFLPDGDVLGKRLNFLGEDWLPIIGVVGDIRQTSLDTPGVPEVYFPMNQSSQDLMHMVVRSDESIDAIGLAMRNEVASMDPSIPVTLLSTMNDVVATSITTPRFYTLLVSIFAAVALLLALIGLYGTMSYSVSQRTQEIGICMALGSQSTTILLQVLWRGMRLTLIGIVLGILGALASTRVLENFLYGIEHTDPMTFALAATCLALVALLACYLPARRATRIDPMTALREE